VKQLTAETLDEYKAWDCLTVAEQKEWKAFQKKTKAKKSILEEQENFKAHLFDYFGMNNCNKKFCIKSHGTLKIYTVEKAFPCTQLA